MDIYFSYLITVIALSGCALYAVKVYTNGRAQYARIEKEGESRLLSKDTMNMAYWWFEPLAYWCHRQKITPNQISWVSFACGVVAAIAVATGLFGLAGLSLLLAGLLDMLDGMVARMSEHKDPAGVVLDSSLDRYVDFFFLAGLVIYYKDSTVLMIIALLAMLGSFMISYSTAKAEAMQIKPPRGAMKRGERMAYLIIASVLTPYSITFFESQWTFEPALGLPVLLVVSLIAILSNVSAVQRLTALGLAARKTKLGNS